MQNTKKIIIPAIFCALLVVAAFIRIPLPPVPITLQTLVVLLLGLCCPWSICLEATIAYLFIGAIGFPVFTSGGGLGALFGPTGGFLLSWPVASVVCSFLCGNGKGKHVLLWDILAIVVATLLIYAVGVPFLKYSRSLTWAKAFAGGMFPFLIGDAVKAACAILLAIPLRKKMTEWLHQEA
jgi:biotin transport system substrate-specific component